MSQEIRVAQKDNVQTVGINQKNTAQAVIVGEKDNTQAVGVNQKSTAQTVRIEPTVPTQVVRVETEVLFLKGDDGYSPTVDVQIIDEGHIVTVTDAYGAKDFFVPDGVKVTPEQIDESVNNYLTEHPVEIDVADEVAEGDSRPVSSAAVHVELGNIDAILKTI